VGRGGTGREHGERRVFEHDHDYDYDYEREREDVYGGGEARAVQE
jgi:hypothetical protein